MDFDIVICQYEYKKSGNSSPATCTQSSNVEMITREEFDRIIGGLKQRNEENIIYLKQVA